MRKKDDYLLTIVCVAFLLFGCKSDQPEKFIPELSVVGGQSSFVLPAEGGTFEITISANAQPVMQMPAWITCISPKASATSKLVFQLTPNTEGKDRTGMIMLVNSELSVSLTVSQPKQEDPILNVEGDQFEFDFPAEGGRVEMSVSANALLSMEMPDWISLVSSGSKAVVSSKLVFQIGPNNSGKNRVSSIVLKNKDLSVGFKVAQAWEIKIPDPNFKAFLLEHFDLNADGAIIPAEADAVTVLNAEKPVDPENVNTSFISLDIASLEGIQAFTNLEELRFRNNKVTELDLSKLKKLRRLNCGQNQIAELNVSSCPKIEGLDCSTNPLVSLNLQGCAELTEIYCRYNRLTVLDVSQSPKLKYLHCNDGLLTSLDVSTIPSCTISTVFQTG